MNRFSPLPLGGPTPWDMVRALPSIRRSPLPFLEQCVQRYGDLVAFPLPKQAVVLVNHPAGAKRVLNDNPNAYSKDTLQYRSLALVSGTGLLTADSPPWKQRRTVIQPAFHHGALPAFSDAATLAAGHLREQWSAAPGGVLDVDRALLDVMIGVVGRTLFRDDLARDGGALVSAVDEALRVVMKRAQSPVPAALAVRANATMARSREVLDDACARLVAARRAQGDVADSDDALALLLRAVDAGELEPAAVRDEMVTLIIAGHETVASALTWTLHLLSRHPQVQERLAQELDDVLGASGSSATWSDLPALRYTRAVLDESLRLYPPAWVITRTSRVSDEICGLAIPAGTLVIVSPWLLHRRESSFADAECFDPQRFLGVDGGAARGLSRPTGAYLPFGVGPRLCIGREAALVQASVMLAGLMHGHRVVPVGAQDVHVDALVTLRPRGGLPLRLLPRD